MEIITRKRRFTIRSITAPKPTSYTKVKPERQILSYMQAKKCIARGEEMYLCYINKEVKLSEQQDTVEKPAQSPEIQAKMEELKLKFKDQFGKKLIQSDHPRQYAISEMIQLPPGTKIPNRPLRRYPPVEQAEIEKQVQEMLDQGLVEPSTSPNGAPVLLVRKPDGTWRFCIDYRALNTVTIKQGYPLPRIDDLLDKIQGSQYFSSMDLLQGFYQLPLVESDKEKITFKTNFGNFQFKVVSKGLTNAPSTFQRVMNQVFQKQLNKFVLIYLDDILIFSKTAEEHIKHIEEVLEVIAKNDLSLKETKCHFFQQELKFLGHIISRDGIRPDPEKVAAVEH
jgi:hypothetical protein